MRRALIVDDEESTRLLLQRILEAVPELEVTLAEGGEEALKLVTSNAYDVVLLDLLMPGMGGIEVLTRIRRLPARKATPVIIVSVMDDPPTQVACRSLGVADYVPKPIEREAVIRAVKGALPR